MKKLVLIMAVGLSSCGETDKEKYDRFMSELESPVILIGKTDKAVDNPSVVVKDLLGRVRTFSAENDRTGSSLPSAIADSRNIGDTLK